MATSFRKIHLPRALECTAGNAVSLEVTGTDVGAANLVGYSLDGSLKGDANGRQIKGLWDTAWVANSSTLAYPYDPSCLLRMDGTTTPTDDVTETAFTMTGGVANDFTVTTDGNFHLPIATGLLGAQAPVIAQACTNLLSAENASFEGDTVGNWQTASGSLIVSSTDSFHGSKSLRQNDWSASGALNISHAVIAGLTTAGSQYTASARVKLAVGCVVTLRLWDNLGMLDGASVTGDGTWQVVTCTKTYTVGSTDRRLYIRSSAASGSINVDAVQLETGAVQTPFALPGATPSRTACKMTIPTPFAAGSAISLLLVVNTVWSAAASLVATNLFDTYTSADSGNGVRVRAYTNYVEVMNYRQGATKEKQLAINGTNWAAGANHIVIATLDAANTQQIFLDGVAGATVVGTAARETTNGDSYIGTAFNGSAQFNGSILCAIWGRVLSAGEITALSSLAAWSTLTTGTVTATKAAVTGARHYITDLIFSSDLAGATATVKDGVTTKMIVQV